MLPRQRQHPLDRVPSRREPDVTSGRSPTVPCSEVGASSRSITVLEEMPIPEVETGLVG